MIEIEYEIYWNERDYKYKTKKFESLQALEDWIWKSVERLSPGIPFMSMPDKGNISRISFAPRFGGKVYRIHEIYFDKHCVFSDGVISGGDKFMAAGIDKWLRHCERRRFEETGFIDIEDIK